MARVLLSVLESALPLQRFSYNPSTRTLSAEASDFGPMSQGTWWLKRLYDDACDIGIAIRSHHTTKTQVFYLEQEEFRDGDLVAWHFLPIERNSRVLKVVIFND